MESDLYNVVCYIIFPRAWVKLNFGTKLKKEIKTQQIIVMDIDRLCLGKDQTWI